eukprot:458347-Rhodomonas_salina.1
MAYGSSVQYRRRQYNVKHHTKRNRTHVSGKSEYLHGKPPNANKDGREDRLGLFGIEVGLKQAFLERRGHN